MRLSSTPVKFLALALFTLLALEGVLRLRFAGPVHYLEPAADPELLYQLKSASVSRATGTLLRIPPFDVFTNHRRMRAASPEDDALTSDQRRILFVGDSFTFGQGVNMEATYPSRVGEALKQKGFPVKVLNAAVDGYNFSQIVRSVELRLPELEPELLVVPLFTNDLDRPYELQKMFPSSSLEAALLEHSRIFRLAMLVRYLRSDIFKPGVLSASELATGLERIRVAAEHHHAALLFVFLADLPKKPLDLPETLLAMKIPWVQIPSSAHAPDKTIPGNRHFNEAGHQWVADLLTPAVLAQLHKGATPSL